MAYLYGRRGSRFWWIGWIDSDGIKRQESTGLDRENPANKRRADTLVAQKRLEELQAVVPLFESGWKNWVPGYLATRYSEQPKTLVRYETAWKSISAYLSSQNISRPDELTRSVCMAYMEWRVAGSAKDGVHDAHHNTARWELKILSMLVNEAMARGWCKQNPAWRLGISKRKPAEKPEISEEHIALIWRELQTEAVWMRRSFQIALHTGCRLQETQIDMKDVDIKRMTIHFPDPKGGHKRAFSIPIHPGLLPLFTELVANKETQTLQIPKYPSILWWRFFKRVGLPQYCFHCIRVTFISRGARAGIDSRLMRRLVNHASETIHRVYLRLQVDDLRAPLEALPLPSLRAAQNPNPLPDPPQHQPQSQHHDAGLASGPPPSDSPARQTPDAP